jgi:hypothetical protein
MMPRPSSAGVIRPPSSAAASSTPLILPPSPLTGAVKRPMLLTGVTPVLLGKPLKSKSKVST